MSEQEEAMDEAQKLMKQVRRRIASLGISDSEAARRSGVASGSLARHLGGAYVRSDSLAKYRRKMDVLGMDVGLPPPTRPADAGQALAFGSGA